MSDLDLSGLFEKFGDNNKRRNTEKEKKTKEKQVPVKEQKEDVSVGEASEK